MPAISSGATLPPAGGDSATRVLEIRDLQVTFPSGSGPVHAVRDVGFHVDAGERVGLVGESGSGKSLTALALLGLVPAPGRVTGGTIRLHGSDLVQARERQWTTVRGRRIGMVFQDPMSSLNPVYPIDLQIAEAIRAHRDVGKTEALREAAGLLRRVGIPRAAERAHEYPHRFSGGMRQRAILAMALASEPEVLIADEPTTALDVTVQAQILRLIAELADERRMAVLLISHDLGVVAAATDRVLVLYAGRVVEAARFDQLVTDPAHPYTAGLLASIPSLAAATGGRLPFIQGAPPDPSAAPGGCAFHPRCSLSRGREQCRTTLPVLAVQGRSGHLAACHFSTELGGPVRAASGAAPAPAPAGAVQAGAWADGSALLRVEGLVRHFRKRGPGTGRGGALVHAVDGVSLEIASGETLGVVGESGCGKSTLARALAFLDRPTAGRVVFCGVDLTKAPAGVVRGMRQHLQVVFQDPYASLDPRMRVGEIVTEALRAHGIGDRRTRATRAEELLGLVGLPAEAARRRPHAFSGGQRQRIAIARALAIEPQLVICDEPVSSLDVSVQAQIVNLLHDLQRELGHAYLFISHDLAVIRHLAQRVAVMYLGKIVEVGPVDAVLAAPHHPYTVALLDAAAALTRPGPETGRALPGETPSPIDPPNGCRFRTRCWKAQDVCAEVEPPLVERSPGNRAACHFPEHLPPATAGGPTPA